VASATVGNPAGDSTRSAHRPDGGSGSRTAGVLLLVLAAGLLLNTVVGPLVLGLVDYPISSTMLNQLLGLELVTIFLVVPWTVCAGVLALRDHPAAPYVAFGPAAYSAYMLVQYVLGPEYVDYSLVVMFHVAMTTLSGGLTLWSWSATRAAPVPVLSPRRERAYGAVLLGMAGFVLLRYAPVFAGAVTGAPLPAEFADAATFYWSIVLLDLGVVVPATALGGLALLRGRRTGHRALYCAVGWFALVPPSVAAMAVVMLVDGDPNASLSTTLLLLLAAVGFGWFAVRVAGPLLVGPGRRGVHSVRRRRWVGPR
jgi:hypothetical protein